ncbi:RNA-binding protein [Candidatus Bathyarchaeota archaeon]|nr:RNA-binding protein [Candidatus Bathyarchaeota archaeon]
MSKKRIAIAIPASVVSDTPHLREKTSKIGFIGRAAAIFRIEEIIVYSDNPHVNQSADTDLVTMLLAYMETPQYLRKKLFRIRPELQYAGILPPLRTTHHPLNRRAKDLKLGEHREGITLSTSMEGTLIDIGVEQPALLPKEKSASRKRVTVKVVSTEPQIFVELIDRNQIADYWGYVVTAEKQPLGKIITRRGFDLVIATSRLGIPFQKVAEEIGERWQKAKSILVVFGSPSQGLHEIARREGWKLEERADFTVNMIPLQGTETVRTEEALMATLSVLNMYFHL